MGCMLLPLEYYGLSRRAGRGCHHDNGVAKGLGLLVERGRSVHAASPVHACLAVVVHVRARARARAWWRGWGQTEYYGLSVAR